MTKKFDVTIKFGKTVKNPANEANNGYDFVEETRTYTVSVSDKEEERPRFKQGVAKEKAIRKATKELGFNVTARHIVSVTNR